MIVRSAARGELLRGEFSDARPHAAQAVQARGRQRARQAELLEECRLLREDVLRLRIAVKVAQQRHESAHEGRFRIAAEMAAALAPLAHEPDQGDAAAHAVCVDVLGARWREARPGAVDDGREAFLCVLDEEEIGEHLLLAFGDGHAGNVGRRAPACKQRPGALTAGNMNIGVVTWFWRGLRGHSVTFSALFASVVLGASIAGGLGRLLHSLGVHWLYVLIIPAVLFGWLAKREERWLPDEGKRRILARSLLFGSILLAIVINQIRH